MRDLPPGWAEASVEDLAATFGVTDGPFGSNLKTEHYTSSGPRVIRLQNIGGGSFRDERAHISLDHFERLQKHMVEAGDVLVAALGEVLPRACLAPSSLGKAIVKADCIRIRPGGAVTGTWLMWALNSAGVRDRVADAVKGVGRPRINLGDLRSLGIPVAPRSEQERIVTAIEEAFSKLDAGEAALRATRQRLKRLRESVLAAAVTGSLVPQDPTDEPASKLLANLGAAPCDTGGLPELPHSWDWARLGALGDVVGGVTKDAKRQDDADFVEVPYLRVANVQRGFLDLGTVATIRVSPAAAQKLALIDGDVLFNEGGDRDKLGRGWVWEGQVPGCIHQNHVFRSRLAGGMQPKLVSWWGNTFGKGWFEAHGKQTTNLASLNMKTLKTFPIPVAPTNEQERIVAAVEYRFSFIDACERTVDAGLVRSAAMRRSILKAAFEGRLVPQDPSDEPASVLLDRIRADRDTVGKVPKLQRKQKPRALAPIAGPVTGRG